MKSHIFFLFIQILPVGTVLLQDNLPEDQSRYIISEGGPDRDLAQYIIPGTGTFSDIHT